MPESAVAPAPIRPELGSENGPSENLFLPRRTPTKAPRCMAPDLTTPAPDALVPATPDALLTLTAATSPVVVYLAQLAPASARTMRSALRTIAALLGYPDEIQCPWPQLRYQHTAAIRARLMEVYAPATVTKMLSALKRVLEESWRMGLIDAETYRRTVDVRGGKGSRERPGRAAGDTEVDILLDTCADDDSPAGARDEALLALLAFGGLRRAEAAALTLADLAPAEGDGYAVRVRGKGNKERTVYAGDWVADVLRRWIAVRGDAAGPLFLAIRRGGHLTPRGMTGQAVRLILLRRVEASGIAALRPHDLRRTFISNLLDETDAATAQQLAGHAKVETTISYDRRPERTRQTAAHHLARRRRRRR